MTVEEQKNLARQEKEHMVNTIMIFGKNNGLTKDELMKKTLKQIQNMYEKVMK